MGLRGTWALTLRQGFGEGIGSQEEKEGWAVWIGTLREVP